MTGRPIFTADPYGRLVSLRIDLNMLKGSRIYTRPGSTVDGVPAVLGVGQIIRVVEEEGDAWLAEVERVDDVKNLVHLRLLPCSFQPLDEEGDDDGMNHPPILTSNPVTRRMTWTNAVSA